MEMNRVQQKLRYMKCKKWQNNLTNKTITIITNNCLAGFLYHDLDLPFRSPTINLWLDSKDYLFFLKSLKDIKSKTLNEVKKTRYEYPVGIIDNYHVLFQHYDNFEQSKSAWMRRVDRIDFENLYIVFVQREDTTIEQIKAFDQLDFPNKLFLSNRNMKDIKSVFWIRGFEDEPSIGLINEHRNRWSGTRYYDQFDWVKWFNA